MLQYLFYLKRTKPGLSQWHVVKYFNLILEAFKFRFHNNNRQNLVTSFFVVMNTKHSKSLRVDNFQVPLCFEYLSFFTGTYLKYLKKKLSLLF